MFQRGKDGDLIFYTLNIHKNMPDDNRPIDERRWGENIYKDFDNKYMEKIEIVGDVMNELQMEVQRK